MADGGEDDVGGIASAALEIAAAEVAFGLQVADHGLDGGSTSQLALDHSEDAALLAGDEDAAWILRVMATVSRFVARRFSRLIAACSSLASVGKVMAFGCTVVSTVTRLRSWPRNAPTHGVRLRQSYSRVAKAAAMMASRYAHAKQFKRHSGSCVSRASRLGRIIRGVAEDRRADALREGMCRHVTRLRSWPRNADPLRQRRRPPRPIQLDSRAACATARSERSAERMLEEPPAVKYWKYGVMDPALAHPLIG